MSVGTARLKTTLVQIACPRPARRTAISTPSFSASRAGAVPKKAIVAVAASMLTDVYYMLRDGVEFHDLGDQYFMQHDKTRLANRLLQRLRDLGVEVEVKAA
jgi:hypothetical protein